MQTPLTEDLAGKRALVTGGTKGAGAAIAGRLAQAGATVLVTARTQPAGVDPNLFIAADISTPEGTSIIVAQVIERLGGVDILVALSTCGGWTGSRGVLGVFGGGVRESLRRLWCSR